MLLAFLAFYFSSQACPVSQKMAFSCLHTIACNGKKEEESSQNLFLEGGKYLVETQIEFSLHFLVQNYATQLQRSLRKGIFGIFCLQRGRQVLIARRKRWWKLLFYKCVRRNGFAVQQHSCTLLDLIMCPLESVGESIPHVTQELSLPEAPFQNMLL